MNIILYAIPFFFLLILIEFGYGLFVGRNTYRINDTINSLSLGSLSRLEGLVILGASGFIYQYFIDEFHLFQLSEQTFVWVLCFILYDLLYYWKHRLGHEVSLLWAAHVAHHQSEDFNLGTALRQTSVDCFGFVFYLPLFLIGFPLQVVLGVASLNLIYQFWVHTEHISKLGFLEWIFVTPSNHRVHHARNDIYVDRNYGGVFIIWDRFFGSFQEELDNESCIFGLRKPLCSWNPLWANLHVYWRLILDCWNTDSWTNRWLIWFKPPSWRPDDIKTSCSLKSAKAKEFVKYDPELTSFNKFYGLFHFVVTLLAALGLLIFSVQLDYLRTVVLAMMLGFSFYALGVWMEGRAYGIQLEWLRLACIVFVLWWMQVPMVFFVPVVVLIFLCATFLIQKPPSVSHPA